MKREWAVIKALVRDWERARTRQQIARMLVLLKKSFTENRRVIVEELILADGDIHRAVYELRDRLPATEFERFLKWVSKARGEV